MDELIVKSLRGQATDIELRQLERWRAESKANEGEYQAFVLLWRRSFEGDPPAVKPPPPVEAIMREGDLRRARRESKASRRAVLRSPWTGVGLAAAAAAVVLFLNLPPSVDGNASTYGIFPVESSSGPGDITTLGLSDGSVIRTTPNTRMEFPARVDRREVVLDGRAFFAVTADPVPFLVRTRFGDVTVHGTRFEVATTTEGLRVVVVEGVVRLEAESATGDVGEGQVAYLQPGSPLQVVDHRDPWSMLEWESGLLIYEATPLSRVAAELHQHFGRRVFLADESLGELRITAWFEDETMEEVASAICLVAGVPCEVSNDQVAIGR
jgi:transmembrane sensor